MNNLNSVLIEGNLTGAPELRYMENGDAVCTFSVESKRAFKQDDKMEERAFVFAVETRMRLAEVCGEYLRKGRGVRVVGRLECREVSIHPGTDPTGHVEYTGPVFIAADHVEFKPTAKTKEEGV